MSNHYYSQQPTVASNEDKWSVQLRNIKLTFHTDHGVFSKGKIDFGSELLLETMDIEKDAKLLDMGCGYGPIGLTLAKESSQRMVTMVDVNQRALELATKNGKENQINNIRIIESHLFAEIDDHDYTVIVSNPPIRAGKKVVHTLFEQSYDYLTQGGELWIVIQKKQGAPSTFQKLQDLFGQVEEMTKKKGYRVFRARKS